MIFDNDAIGAAQSKGYADVLITIRNRYDGDPKTKAAYDEYVSSNRRLLTTITQAYGVSDVRADFAEFASFGVRASLQQLIALRDSKDPRIASVEMSKPFAHSQLFTSTAVQMNMSSAWANPNSAYRGSGQNIVVVDSGVQANHAMLAPRVTSEACFGTNGSYSGVTWRSNCVASGAYVSSTSGPGTAAPVVGCRASAPNAPEGDCAHGTNVASIAAGTGVAATIGGQSRILRGIAPAASIHAFQAGSYDVAKVQRPTYFPWDILAALQRVINSTTAGTTNNPYTVNLSLGGGQYPSPCYSADLNEPTPGGFYTAIQSAVSTLKARGVPVIAATGNEGSPYNIAWPACVPGVVKVAALTNNSTGDAISDFSNLGNPNVFPDETFWFAPGGNNLNGAGATPQTVIWAAHFRDLQSTGLLAPSGGTSQATPHIAGIYAIVKSIVPGVSVDGVYSTLLSAGAVQPGPSFTVNDCIGTPSPSPTPCINKSARYNKVRLP